MQVIILVFGIISFLYSLFVTYWNNFDVGLLICYGISIAAILYGVYFKRLAKLKVLNILLITGMICALSFGMILFIVGQTDTVKYDEDALIILGAGIRGETVSLTLAMRLSQAIAYHKKNPSALIIVSGGQGPQEDITEALAMQRYLVSRGVPEQQIIKEEKATSTEENFRYSKEILDKRLGPKYKIAFVTSDFHIFRANAYTKLQGYNSTHLHSQTLWYIWPVVYLREFLAIGKLWLFSYLLG